MNKIYIIIPLAFIIVGGGLAYYLLNNNKNDNSEEKTQETTIPNAAVYSLDTVSMHNTKSDCWLLIQGEVYDVTKFVNSHPGGAAILEGCGKDATQLFETRPMGSGTPHSSSARALLSDYLIGSLEKES